MSAGTPAIAAIAAVPSRSRTSRAAAGKPRSRRRINYGPELKARRKALGMTQRELGVALGRVGDRKGKPIPLATISRWEQGGTIEHPGMLFRALDSLEREKSAAAEE